MAKAAAIIFPLNASSRVNLITMATTTFSRSSSTSLVRVKYSSSIIRSSYSSTKTSSPLSPNISTTSACLASLASRFCDALDSWIDSIEKQASSAASSRSSTRSRSIPNGQPPPPLLEYSGNFLPVHDECSPLDCHIEDGAILPEYLNGVYLRNGPNQRFGNPSTCHLFDGDGMVHAVSISGAGSPQEQQRVTYACRYVRTSRWRQEDKVGRQLFPRVFTSARSTHGLAAAGIARFSLAILRHLLGVIDLSQGLGLANSGLVHHNRLLLALSEDDLPHAISILPDGDLRSLGRFLFHSSDGAAHQLRRLPIWAMTSHPKIDPSTGEMFAFGYNPLFPPHLTFFTVSPTGKTSAVPVTSLREASMMHDFGLTPRYAIFPDVQLVFRPLRLLRGRSPLVVDQRKVPRMGLLPRDARDDRDMRWFEVPGCNCFHVLNCWEEEGDVVVAVVPVVESVAHAVEGDLHNFKVSMKEVRLNTKSGEVEQRAILREEDGELNLEMGSMDREKLGRRSRYVYMGMAGDFPSLSGVAKVDVKEGKVVAKRRFGGDKCFGSEPFFVSAAPAAAGGRHGHNNNGNGKYDDDEEEEGCVVSFVHDEEEGVSHLLVLDAVDLSHVASIRLPRRVPYGFHGLFVPRSSPTSHPME